ncbi:MAG: lysophospholipase [Clostridia bacterium]|nr:lysophospholipase [Clostridia bacterium]
MTALEIVMVSLSATLVCLIAVIFIIGRVITKYLTHKVVDYSVLNEFAPENPIVFLGDSLTDLFPVHEFLPDERIINRGISNETTFDVGKRLDDIIVLKPRAVFLLVGINDYLRLKKKSEPRTVAERVITIADKLSSVCSDVRVISLYPINPKKTKISAFYLRKTTNEKINSTNAILRKLCIEKGYKYIDIHSYLIDENGYLKADYTIEGLHLNLKGYAALTPYYKEQLNSIE